MFASRSVAVCLVAFLFVFGVLGQSSSQEFPTAVASNELAGTIKVRDIGDSRLTTYYYTFNGEQGDIFINLVSKNFTGDLDVFTANGLRPLTKIVVYAADQGEIETGRVIYLRKPERLLLRVQGRSPNDEEAAFRLKFGGSFLAVRPEDVPAAPELPKVNAAADNRVNSVGTIIPRPARSPEPTAERELPPSASQSSAANAEIRSAAEEEKAAVSPETTGATNKIDKAAVSEPASRRRTSARGSTSAANTRRTENTKGDRAADPESPKSADPAVAVDRSEEKTVEKTAEAERSNAAKARPVRTLTANRNRAAKPKEEPKPDPLASINLVVQFKNGEVLERKMSEVFKFSVDKGVLVVILKDGAITRYPIVEVAKLTIE